ncbi:hypothetical protein EMPS_08538 [Entomortierella parvispora]|uniref:Uncharacterized protein n=1 Tax=Entomortierella parvispora TaxID=205924 RepID=A0A9P3LZD8_9FUNG|nr:hypothetical protein EMPS_08538 [Entomortierella parvispora]
MRFSILAIASAIAVFAVSASPVSISKRSASTDILNFALTLEHLESTFYKEGLAKFSQKDFEKAGYHGKVREYFEHIGEHENTHVDLLTSIIKSLHETPVPVCKYNFPLTDVDAFIAISRALENTGVSAYLGASSSLAGGLLTTAGTITTVEARQSSYLNTLVGGEGTPYNFDTPLTAQEVFTMASGFIVSCPYNVGVKPYTQLTASVNKNSSKVATSFKGKGAKNEWCQFLFSNQVVVSPRSKCTVPKEVNGYFYVVITDTKTPLTAKDGAHIVAGPALLFEGDH